jgi:hypothetical protein
MHLRETTSERRTHLFLELPCKVSMLSWVDVGVLPNENRTIVILDEYLQVRRIPLLESANLTVNRRVFIWTLHRLRLSSSHSSRPYISEVHPGVLFQSFERTCSCRCIARNSNMVKPSQGRSYEQPRACCRQPRAPCLSLHPVDLVRSPQRM